MSIPIAMPQLGLTMTEGTVSVWLKKPGDAVKKDEALLTVSTDKVDMDIESPADGVLREVIVDPGQTVPVGTQLAFLDVPGERAAAGEQARESTVSSESNPVPAQPQAVKPSTEDGADVLSTSDRNDRAKRVAASPRAKRAALELGINLADLKGSGLGGRILEEDVRKAIPRGADPHPGDTDVKRRQLITARMVESITTIPSFSVSVEVNAENFVALYESLKEPVGRAASNKLTYTDLLLKALAVSLAKTPEMNMLWNGGAIRRLAEINLGLAIATGRGVTAPTLTEVDRFPLERLVRRRAELTDKARQSRLTFADMEGAVGTLSNLGMYRVDRFEGIITPGQTFILAVGKLQKRPWVETTIVIKPTLVLNLSVDHRVADGAAAAIFLEHIAEVIENPYQILWNVERN